MRDRLATAAIVLPLTAALIAFGIWYHSAAPQEWHYFDTPAGVMACYGRHDDVNRYVPSQCKMTERATR